MTNELQKFFTICESLRQFYDRPHLYTRRRRNA